MKETRFDTDCINKPADIKKAKLINKPWTREQIEKAKLRNKAKTSNKKG